MRGILPVLLLAALAAAVVPAKATPILGQVDDFEDGTTQNWTVGGAHPNPPVNIATGGPAGANDNYLEVEGLGGFGPGSKLGTFNLVQWAGDFLANGVNAIQADMRVFEGADLEMRVFMQGAGGDFTSLLAQTVPADGQWHTITFNVSAAGLTAVGGTSVNDTLANANRVLLRHQPGGPVGIGGAPGVDAVLGIDNVRALPEPATLTLLTLGGFLLARRRR
ncbi:MAG: PEP-CTERM sorting domain-containing protein [Phycisphaerales bacterium]|nr:PEP-CTERM sorting domain-containing protein [Phycisphaerales bacterium]